MFPCYVVLDLETTGGSGARDRITEIAGVRVEHGQETARFQSLVNPEAPIPPYIERLTGISNAMVADAPSFKSQADSVLALLDGAVLVAHNAAFDHGFLRGEFQRLGQELRNASLCTVRLSRALYPQHKSHGLDALIERHGLHTEARHRAMGDVELVLDFLRIARASFGADRLAATAQELLQLPLGIPVHLETALDDLPRSPGTYAFFNEAGQALCVGHGTDIRAQVEQRLERASHRSSGSARERGIAANTQRIEHRATAGLLSAHLAARAWAQEVRPTYDTARSAPAVDPRALHPWPHTAGRRVLGLRELDEESGQSTLLLFRDWVCIGQAQDEEALADILQQGTTEPPAAAVDLDLYRLLVQQLLKPGSAAPSALRF